MKILDTRVANNFSKTYANLKEPPATLETERLKRNEYRARHGPLYHKFHARHGVHTDILKDSSTPWAKGVAAAGRSTNRGWVIRRYEGMQRVEGRTQSGLHFSCRGRPGSYWKYLHVIYGAHMLQEPNAPPCYPLLPSPPFACSYSLPPFAQTPFPLLFLFGCLPFSVLRNGRFCRCSFSSLSLPLTHLLHPLTNPSETCRQRLENSTKRFTPLLLLPLSFRRRNNEYSYGLNFWWSRPLRALDPYPSIHPSPLSFASTVLVHLVRTAWKRRDDFLFLYRFLQVRDTISNKVEKGTSKKNEEVAMHALRTQNWKIKISAIVIPHQ